MTMDRAAMRWALFVVLAVVALAYFATPSRTAEACETWKAEMWEDEGGPVLTAFNCAEDAEEAYLNLYCSDGSVWLRLDLAYGAERSPDLDEERDVVFSSGDQSETVRLLHQAMDGLFANGEPISEDLLSLLRSGEVMDVRDTDGFYPHRRYALAGSLRAIGTLLDGC